LGWAEVFRDVPLGFAEVEEVARADSVEVERGGTERLR